MATLVDAATMAARRLGLVSGSIEIEDPASLPPVRVRVDRVEELLRNGGIVDVEAPACRKKIDALHNETTNTLKKLSLEAREEAKTAREDVEALCALEVTTEITFFDLQRGLQAVLAKLPEDRRAQQARYKFFGELYYVDGDSENLRQVLNAFQVEKMHLVQAARLLERHVQFDLSFVLSHLAKVDRELTAARKKACSAEKTITTHHREFQKRCKELGILGVAIASELQIHAESGLPKKLQAIWELLQQPALTATIDYFDDFVRESHSSDMDVSVRRKVLNNICDVRAQSFNVPHSLSELKEQQRPEAQQDLLSDQMYCNQYTLLQASMQVVRASTSSPVESSGDPGSTGSNDEIDWDIDLDFEPSQSSTASDSEIAKDAVTLKEVDAVESSLLFSAVVRDAVLRDLYLLKAFLRQRQLESSATSSHNGSAATAWLNNSAVAIRSREDIESFLEAISGVQASLEDKELIELTIVDKGGPRFQRMVLDLEYQRGLEDKARDTLRKWNTRVDQLQAEKKRLVPKRIALENRVKILKRDLESAMQESFAGRRFEVTGIAKFL